MAATAARGSRTGRFIGRAPWSRQRHGTAAPVPTPRCDGAVRAHSPALRAKMYAHRSHRGKKKRNTSATTRQPATIPTRRPAYHALVSALRQGGGLRLGALELREAGVLAQLPPPPGHVAAALEHVGRVRRHIALQELDRFAGLSHERVRERLERRQLLLWVGLATRASRDEDMSRAVLESRPGEHCPDEHLSSVVLGYTTRQRRSRVDAGQEPPRLPRIRRCHIRGHEHEATLREAIIPRKTPLPFQAPPLGLRELLQVVRPEEQPGEDIGSDGEVGVL